MATTDIYTASVRRKEIKMKFIRLAICALSFTMIAPATHAVTLTFDDIPQGMGLEYYSYQYGIGFGRGFFAADHTGSAWGPPRSGNNVLAWNFAGVSNWYGMLLKDDQPLRAYAVGGYFSTEPGVVLEMIGYYRSLDNPVASVTIGAAGESWNNVYFQIDSPAGQINAIEFKPVTTDALSHFCADDITVNFVPEPSSLLALSLGLPLAGLAMRWRR